MSQYKSLFCEHAKLIMKLTKYWLSIFSLNGSIFDLTDKKKSYTIDMHDVHKNRYSSKNKSPT